MIELIDVSSNDRPNYRHPKKGKYNCIWQIELCYHQVFIPYNENYY